MLQRTTKPERRCDSAALQLELPTVTVVQRYDTIALPAQSYERTPQGGIRAPARFTRVGVLEYELPDGTKRREWRPPEEVFRPESFSTLDDAPITVHHPDSGEVKADSYQRESVGHVRAGVKPEGEYLSGLAVVQDESTVRGALGGALGELSAGYKCSLEHTPGVVPEGQPDAGKPYDCIQRGITYNHVAILPPGLGRAGREVSLRLDSLGHQLDPTKEPTMELTPEESAALKTLLAMLPKLQALLGAPAPVAPAPAPPAAPTTDTEPAPAAAAAPKEEPKTDNSPAATPEEKKTDAKDTKPMTPEEQERIVNDSIDLRDKARTVLGADYSFAGKSNRDVMAEVVKRVDSTIKLEGRSDDALRALFDMALPRFGEQEAAKRAEHFSLRSDLRTDAKDDDLSFEEQLQRGSLGKKSA